MKLIELINKPFLKVTGILFSFFIGIITVYQFTKTDKIEIEIKTIDKTQLTKTPDIDALTVEYKYQDSIVKNLWKMRYVILNVGSKTIIGKGDNKNIILENLSISFNDSVKILSVYIGEKNFPVIILDDKIDKNLNLNFKQWKKSEFIDITVIVENLGIHPPVVTIDERDIIDSKIIYSKFNPNELNDKRKKIDYLPKGVSNVLVWVIIFVYIFSILFAIIGTISNNFTKTERTTTFFIVLFAIMLYLLPLLWVF